MASFRDLLSRTKAEIREVDTAAAEAAVGRPGTVVLDVREPDEYDQGALPGAVHIPRGHLESQIEARLPDRGAPVVVYCAGGVRSAFAARTLQDLGLHRRRVDGRRLRQVEGRGAPVAGARHPHRRTSATATSATCCCPRSASSGQAKLLESKVLLLGAGGLGSPAALYLAAAGVGTLGIVDMDEVDASNLQRQILHNLDRIGERKVDSAKKTLVGLNPDVNVVTYDTRLVGRNVMDLLTGYDVVIDGADNFPSRYLLNDASVKLGIPVVHGSIFRFEGMVTVFDPKTGPNYRDMVPEPPPAELAPSCAEAGVLGVLPGIIGSLQALEAIKLLLDLGDPLIGRILSFDALEMSFRTYKLRVDPTNPVTWDNRDAIEIAEYDELCAAAASVAFDPKVLVTTTAGVRNVANRWPSSTTRSWSSPLEIESAACCICGGTDGEPIGVGEDFEYRSSNDSFLAVRCPQCTLVYLDPRPAPAELSRIYPDDYHAFEFSAEQFGLVHAVRSRLEARRILKVLGRLPDGARILDVGCGDGFHLDLLRTHGPSQLGARRRRPRQAGGGRRAGA